MRRIRFFHEDVKGPRFKRNTLRFFLNEWINEEGKTIGDISIIFCSDEYLLQINQSYLNHDFLTDVITFDYCESNIISGDIYISIDRIKENAILFSQDFENEFYRVIFHGILHLLKYNDKTKKEKTQMTIMENYYLIKFKNQRIV